MTKRLRVLVVDDSPTVRAHLTELLNADPELEVAGEAADGKRAIELCRLLRPDVITLDMMLPLMSGVAVTEYVMAYCPTPILVVSASINRGELLKTYDALAAGAVDVFEKPSAPTAAGCWEREFISAVKTVARIRVITHIRGRARLTGRSNGGHKEPHGDTQGAELIAIGASTGGPAAIVEILRGLPADFPIPVLVLIHIGEPFSSSFADWLDGLSVLRVRYAEDGDALPEYGQPGVLMAPPGAHLAVRGRQLRLERTAERNSCRPSVDVLFESLAMEVGRAAVGCLLTGMGHDGAAGLLEMRRAGALTIAQDEATSIVFGMPREAIALGAAERVLALDQIARALMEVAREVELRRKS